MVVSVCRVRFLPGVANSVGSLFTTEQRGVSPRLQATLVVETIRDIKNSITSQVVEGTSFLFAYEQSPLL